MKRLVPGALLVSLGLWVGCDSGESADSSGEVVTSTRKASPAPTKPVEKRERPPFSIEAGASAADIFGDTLTEEERTQLDRWPDARSQQLRESRFSKKTIPAPVGFDADKASVDDWRGVMSHLEKLRAHATGRGEDPTAFPSEVAIEVYAKFIRAGAEHRTAQLFVDMHIIKHFVEAGDPVAAGREFLKLDKRYGGLIAEHHAPDNVEEEGYYHPQTLENALVVYRYMTRMKGRGPSLELSLEYLDDRADLLCTMQFLSLNQLDVDMMAQLASAEASALEGAAKLHWTDGETAYYLFENKTRKTIAKTGEKVTVLEAEAARAALAKHVQGLIAADKATRKRGLATMHYADSYDVILADTVTTVEPTEAKRIEAGRPASASHELTLALAKRGKAKTPFFDHPGLALAPELRSKGTALVEQLMKAYPGNSFEIPEPPEPAPAEEPAPETKKAPPKGDASK